MKTDIDPDFEITDKLRAWAAVKAPRVDIDLETEKFVDYWLAHGTRMASWEATWRNWMRRAPEMGGCMKAANATYRRPPEVTEEQRKADAAKAWAELNRLKAIAK
jgi:hypothetical protein